MHAHSCKACNSVFLSFAIKKALNFILSNHEIEYGKKKLYMYQIIVCSDFIYSVLRLIERAVDKSSRLLPYEDTLLHLENLYEAVDTDGELMSEQKQYIKSQIESLEKSLQVCYIATLNLYLIHLVS